MSEHSEDDNADALLISSRSCNKCSEAFLLLEMLLQGKGKGPALDKGKAVAASKGKGPMQAEEAAPSTSERCTASSLHLSSSAFVDGVSP